MSKLHRLPLALAAMTAATPALAHEADFVHTHGENLIGVVGFVVAVAVAIRIAMSIARK
ncbi:MAG: hypothetical protein AAF494_06850 [Pseudomonadota bacterium]